MKDGRGNTITLANWKRGIPQTVGFPDATQQTATVDDAGWIRSTSDQNGFTTQYGYDAMGRITQIDRPGADTVAWNSTTQVYEAI
ncbi:RHS repeat domain-containing protein [Stenotrophomonas nematodicola]|uniref:RHS repeat domain-containing protein n=1 Tax=Stenotrophomonas nematodicola TaxID=2656746 RepID=A0ABW7D3R3_9GAMM